MALIVETGEGVPGAESYASVATISAYWAKRGHTAFATTWAAANVTAQEGAAREAADYLDAHWGPFYRGFRKGYVQGRLFPRIMAKDETGYYLPSLPPELVQANCELAARALVERLSEDADQTGSMESLSVKVGPISETLKLAAGGSVEKKFGFIDGLLAPILDRAVPGTAASWAWR